MTAGTAGGQVINWYESSSGGAHLGTSVCSMGDLDGDGVEELAVGAPWPTSPDARGSVKVVSGATGALLLSIEAQHPSDRFGTAVVAPGDLDGDGTLDLVVCAAGSRARSAAERPGSVAAFSGADGSLLWRHEAPPGIPFGWRAASAGDCTGDGVGDLVVSSGGARFRVSVLDGVTGEGERELFAEEGGSYGYALCSLPDLDGDGSGDFAVATPQGQAGGLIALLSGARGQELGVLEDPSGGDGLFGISLSAGGDVDGDGKADLLVGFVESGAASGTHDGVTAVAAYSLHDLTRIGALHGESGFSPGHLAAFAGDVDGDGADEILTGGEPFGCVALLSWNGTAFAVQAEFRGSSTERFGASMAVLRGPAPAVAIGAPWTGGDGGASHGAVHVFEMDGSLRFTLSGHEGE